MKKALILLAVATVTASSVGCGRCRSLCPCCLFGRNNSFAAPVASAACPACSPQPVFAPAQQPVFAAAPQQFTVPQYAQPQFMAPAAQPVYSEAGCSGSFAAETSCGIPYSVADPGCGYTEAGFGGFPQEQHMMIDPSPAQ